MSTARCSRSRRRRRFDFRRAVLMLRPELAAKLIGEGTEPTLFDEAGGFGTAGHRDHDRQHGQRQLHLWGDAGQGGEA